MQHAVADQRNRAQIVNERAWFDALDPLRARRNGMTHGIAKQALRACAHLGVPKSGRIERPHWNPPCRWPTRGSASVHVAKSG